ncbi:MAG: hypothetical protein ACE5QV_04420, partial [Fidelibacterota bacterium]
MIVFLKNKPVKFIDKSFRFELLLIYFLLFSFLSPATAYPQRPHGDRQYRKTGVMDGNLIRTLFFNHGEVAHWPDQPSGEWPKGSGHSYVDGIAPFIAARVVDIYGNVITPVETQYREYMDIDAETGYPMGFEPLPGYANQEQDSPAMSNNLSSWPEFWPDRPRSWGGYWNGYFG